MPSVESNKNVLFIVPYAFNTAPGQRFRFEQYLIHLQECGINYDIDPFLDSKTTQILYTQGNLLRKMTGFIAGYFRRIYSLTKLSRYTYIYIFREATPLGPPMFEYFIAKILKKKVIYDFDDAIWLEDPEERGTMKAVLKSKWKIKYICQWSSTISVGNEYLKQFAIKYNQDVRIIPTTIDTDNVHNPKKIRQQVRQSCTIGWTGTHSTLQYLNPIVPTINRLSEKYNLRVKVIANKAPLVEIKNLEFVTWNDETEIKDLADIDIGIMPLTDDAWSKGKCGFKALQYMALGKPAVVSKVGVNSKIVDHGKNGYLCEGIDDWEKYLELLILHPDLRQQFGKMGRNKVIEEYSVNANKVKFLALFP